MRLLFDEPLPERLCSLLEDQFPGSLHVRTLGHGGAADEVLWRVARDRGCVIVTKDSDFERLVVVRGAPPKVIWIRLGNCTTRDLEALLRASRSDIADFMASEDLAVLEIG